MRWPRVVGLMPTKNRPQMAHRAVHLFLEQQYEGDKHLLVFDDGVVPIETCYGCRGRFELVRCNRMNLPTKRNAMMLHVNDPDAIYFMWDDDDYHGPMRVATQLDAVLEHHACILRPTLYYNAITHDLRVSRWISDATVAYDWSFWDRRRYHEQIDPGSGRQFVTYPRPVAEVRGVPDYIAVVHRGQRHTPPAFGPPDFTETDLTADWARERLRLR